MKLTKLENKLIENKITVEQYVWARFELWGKNYGTYKKIDKDFENGKLIFKDGFLQEGEHE